MNALSRSLAAALMLAATGAALAQATITHDKALAGSVTPGDSAGYPITISQPGSYKLMSNLLVPAGSDGIVITASDVSLDLNGFRILGPGNCYYQYYKAICTAQAGTGIRGTDVRGLSIASGSVLGFFSGIAIDDGRVSEINLRHNFYGLAIGFSMDANSTTTTLISGVHATLNRTGIATTNPGPFFSASAFIERSVLRMNETAIAGEQGTVVNESAVTGNGTGIYGAKVRGTLASGNGTNTVNTSAY